MLYDKEQKIKIWNDIKDLSEDKQKIEDKLQELFIYKDYDSYYKKLEYIYYFLDIENMLNSPKIENIIFTLLDGLISYEYFNKHIADKGHYDYQKIRRKFEEIEQYLVADSKITLNPPIHPNYSYNDLLHTLSKEYKINKDIAQDLLNIIFDTSKKPPQTAQTKREFAKIIKILNKIIDTAEERGKHSKEDIEQSRKEITELKKELK